MKHVMKNYDFGSNGTLKGGVMHLQRQTSMGALKNRVSKKPETYTAQVSTPSENTIVLGKSGDISLKVSEHHNLQRLTASTSKKKQPKTIADDSDSSGSE